ncbi:hypothetical protein NPIL_57111 [Nephila pilipes]|uniref:Uncharacterized protein n=1 Tax=Nephila pilipes TaxID=299642 RepID=A0A8X6T9H6_NEPPI|nr:hypothetical protein NPIL_57111 [Nephila pilipes]
MDISLEPDTNGRKCARVGLIEEQQKFMTKYIQDLIVVKNKDLIIRTIGNRDLDEKRKLLEKQIRQINPKSIPELNKETFLRIYVQKAPTYGPTNPEI